MNPDIVSSQIIQASTTVHKNLGPGLVKPVYQKCMIIELENMGLNVEPEVAFPIFYREQKITDLNT